MACPTCDHTMQMLACGSDLQTEAYFWCPRCGTLKYRKAGEVDAARNEIPRLVSRVREYSSHPLSSSARVKLRTLGILESINRPEDR